MEFDDWSPVIAFYFREHMTSEDAIARAFSVALIGDDGDWKQHQSNAKRFLAAMRASMPGIPAMMGSDSR